MASPAIATTNNSIQSTAVTSHTVNLPTGITAGDLLVVFFMAASSVTPSTPAGWTTWGAEGQNPSPLIAYRVADGTEGSTVTVSTGSTSTKSAHASYRITGASSTGLYPAPGFSSLPPFVQGTSANPDSPSLTPAGGNNDYLFIALEGVLGPSNVTVYPTSYTLGQVTTNSGGTGGSSTKVGIGVAARQLTGTVDDPSAFTVAASASWTTVTLAIGPAVAANPFHGSLNRVSSRTLRGPDVVRSY